MHKQTHTHTQLEASRPGFETIWRPSVTQLALLVAIVTVATVTLCVNWLRGEKNEKRYNPNSSSPSARANDSRKKKYACGRGFGRSDAHRPPGAASSVLQNTGKECYVCVRLCAKKTRRNHARMPVGTPPSPHPPPAVCTWRHRIEHISLRYFDRLTFSLQPPLDGLTLVYSIFNNFVWNVSSNYFVSDGLCRIHSSPWLV